MKQLLMAVVLFITVMLTACANDEAVQTPTPDIPETAQAEPVATIVSPSSTPVKTTAPKETVTVVVATITVRDGDTLERDIIPQLKEAFSFSEEEIKDALSDAESDLIGEAKGFRRMEGIIVPGSYDIAEGESLEYWINEWIDIAERRYDELAAQVPVKNSLSISEQLILASIVEGDTNLADSYEDIAATVFMNRIEKNDRFGSCPTVEYALGYQRPYLTSEDIKVDSEYNTYKIRGLPPGPICCIDDESLQASISEPSDLELYFFFYDYVKEEILSFTSYADFKVAATVSKELFENTYDISRFEKMEDKREYFGR